MIDGRMLALQCMSSMLACTAETRLRK